MISMALMTLFMMATLACSSTPRSSDEMVFMAGFKPQANLPFVAAYVAQEKGYFKEQGLEVEILHASSGEHLQLLMSGDVDVTTADATSVLKRRSDPGLPITAFALFGQRGQQGFVALESSGIRSPADWEGHTFGYKFSQPPHYLALLDSQGVDRSTIKEVRVGFDPRVLTEGRVDILAIFKSNEPDTIRRLGFEVVVWDPEDFGVPSLGLTYITREEDLKNEAERYERFLKATLKGLRFAMDNREETLDIVLKYAPGEVREHQAFMLETELRDAVGPVTRELGMGWMKDDQWRALYEQLIEFEALPGPFEYETAYTDDILRAVYEDGSLQWP